MMTSVLRDSLGGNCMTTMIATVSVEKKNIGVHIFALILTSFLLYEKLHICLNSSHHSCTSFSLPLFLSFFSQESLSTCRFAQRVALIKNDALLNEELDPALVSLVNLLLYY